MSPSNTARDPHADWRPLCRTADLVAGSGIVALAGGQQVALFYLPGHSQELFAIDHHDPIAKANVLARGIVGDIQGEPVVA
ncbi:MAG: nitrite reductase (NAD(P)H) small subunit, partial [Pseudomonas aeruginosa]